MSNDVDVERTGKGLIGTAQEGLTCASDTNKGLEVFVDAEFTGGFYASFPEDATSMGSRTRFVIKHAG